MLNHGEKEKDEGRPSNRLSSAPPVAAARLLLGESPIWRELSFMIQVWTRQSTPEQREGGRINRISE